MKTTKRNRKWDEKAISTLLSTILLLAIAISLVCVFYVAVFKNSTSMTSHSVPSIDLVGGIKNDRNISFINRGGDTLQPNTKVLITIGQNSFNYTIGGLNGNKGLAPGASLTFNIGSYLSLNGLEVQYILVDPDHNTVISTGVIQEGEMGVTPYVQTVSSSSVTSHAARLTLYYNFITNTFGHPKVRIQYKTDSALSLFSLTNPPWYNVSSVQGTYFVDVGSLLSAQSYVFQAELTYDGLSTPYLGTIMRFTTSGDEVSEWNFDAGSGPAIDSVSINNGALIPDGIKGPHYVTTGKVNNATILDGINDRFDVADAANLRLSDQLGIETWVKPQQNSNASYGNIANIAATQFADANYGCNDPDWVSISGTSYYAVVTRNSAGAGYLVTLKIATNGTVITNATTAIVSKYNFASTCYTPRIIASTISNVYIIVYSDNNNYGVAATVNIFNNGTIKQPVLKTLSFCPTTKCYNPDVISVINNIYMIAFGSSSDKNLSYGYIQNIYVNNSGANISKCQPLYAIKHDAVPAGLKYQKTLMQEPSIVALATGTSYNFAIAYRCRNDDGGVCVVKVSQTNGNITLKCGERKFDTKRAENPKIFYLNNQFYGLVYGCEGTSYSSDNDINRVRGFITLIKIYTTNGTIVPGNASEAATTFFSPSNSEYEIPQTDYSSYTNYTFRNPRVIKVSQSGNRFTMAFSFRLYFKLNNFNRSYIRVINITTGSPYASFTDVKSYSFDYAYWSTTSPIGLGSAAFFPIGTGTTFGLIYRKGISNNGILKTLTIPNNGNISSTPVLDYYELGIESCSRGRAVRVTNTLCAVLYQESTMNTFLKTFRVYATGITPWFNDSYRIEKGYVVNSRSYCYDASLINLTGGYFAVVYRNYTNNVKLYVFQIDTSGGITKKYTSTIAIDKTYTPKLIKVPEYSNVYVIAYMNYTSPYPGRLSTLKITSSSCTVLCTTTFNAQYGYYANLCAMGNSTYAVVFYGYNATANSYGGDVRTFKILSTGNNITLLYNYYLGTGSYFYYPYMVQVNQSVYAISYCTYSSGYFTAVLTIRIQPSGYINRSWIDSCTYPAAGSGSTTTSYPIFLKVSGRIHAFTYTNNAIGSGVATIRIGENGNLTTTSDNTVGTSADTSDTDITSMGNNLYVLSYGYAGLMERVIKISITPQQQMIFGKTGSYELYANATTATAKITDITGPHTISALLSYTNDWNYIVVTYKQGGYFNLTINANNAIYNGHQTAMKNSSSNRLKNIYQGTTKLSFGGYNGIYDEFTLWASELAPTKIQARYNNPNS